MRQRTDCRLHEHFCCEELDLDLAHIVACVRRHSCRRRCLLLALLCSPRCGSAFLSLLLALLLSVLFTHRGSALFTRCFDRPSRRSEPSIMHHVVLDLVLYHLTSSLGIIQSSSSVVFASLLAFTQVLVMVGAAAGCLTFSSVCLSACRPCAMLSWRSLNCLLANCSLVSSMLTHVLRVVCWTVQHGVRYVHVLRQTASVRMRPCFACSASASGVDSRR